MTGPKKFGAFAGVFTPSILTILGVIMYMRMGWVVGNAGLVGTLTIILVAHVISFSTGLSVSSIATDKKVGAGGIYYVLSRSLGLPIGGAIGLTLFVGTALSIALYLVGFAESFNAYLGLETNVEGYRITGSIALVSLMIIALISTSVALKTQFFIMAAIGLSLISIALGTRELAPAAVPFFGGKESADMMTVFAIFFPAVTGFTAGIAMSGDLRNPKSSIPIGTISAIVAGFLIYVGLAVFIAFTVDPQTLRSDNLVLLKIAFFAPAVVAGIWGATLSSALGGILGGPRILQAMSVDRITPRIFGRGKGKDNEPWNALFLCLLIAEAGILIGELDVIARVVSMFYLTAYGFINLSFFLESWASSDFNPTFRISRWIGLVGFVATFMVMFQLDMLAMFAAFVIISLVYLWLVRKELSLGTGDIWNSVWTSVVKTGLQRMDVNEEHKRNWKPNILLFSGGTRQRPHLLEFADAMTGKVGIATNFDLIENPEAQILFPKHQQAVTDPELRKYGMFGRRLEVQNVFKGIETIATTFGFSGIDPNTVLMGWAKNTTDPIWFTQMTQRLIDLDYNVLYLDYDERYRFRDYGTIDLWWRDISNNAELMLSLTRFLLKSDKWRDAQLRILLVNNQNIDYKELEVRVQKILEQFRMQATIRIIDNSVEKTSIYQLMRIHSSDAALVMLGIPIIKSGSEKNFVERTNELVGVIGTTLLVKASSQFDETNLGLQEIESKPMWQEAIPAVDPLRLPSHPQLKTAVLDWSHHLNQQSENFTGTALAPIARSYQAMIGQAREHIERLFDKIEKSPRLESAYRLLSRTTRTLERLSADLLEKEAEVMHELLRGGLTKFRQERIHLVRQAPRFLFCEAENGGATIRIPWKKLLQHHYHANLLPGLQRAMLNFGRSHYAFLHAYSRLLEKDVLELLLYLGSRKPKDAELAIRKVRERSFQDLDRLQREAAFFEQFTLYNLQNADRQACNKLSLDLDRQDLRDHLREQGKNHGRNPEKEIQRQLESFPDHWRRNQRLFHRKFETGLKIHGMSLKLGQLVEQVKADVELHYFKMLEIRLRKTYADVQQAIILLEKGRADEIQPSVFRIEEETYVSPESIAHKIERATENLADRLPERLEVISSEAMDLFDKEQGDQVEIIELAVDKIAAFLLQTHFVAPVEQHFHRVVHKAHQAFTQLLNAANALAYAIQASREEGQGARLPEALGKTMSDLEVLQEELEILEKSFQKDLEICLRTTHAELDIKNLTKEAPLLQQHIRQKKSLLFLRRWWSRVQSNVNNRLHDLQVQLARRRQRMETVKQVNRYAHLHSDYARASAFMQQLALAPDLRTALPFYYRQLFSGKHISSRKSLHNRQHEEGLAAEWIGKIGSGFSGALLVLGGAGTGKSYFCEQIAESLLPGTAYYILPPKDTATEASDLRKAFQMACDAKGPVQTLLKTLPAGSVFVVDDLERWWFRGQNSHGAIDALASLILEFGTRHFFILNANLHAYSGLQAFTAIQKCILQTLFLGPLTRRELQEVILFRHKTGGMKLSYRDRTERKLSATRLIPLFKKLHRYSEGNVGAALQTWLRSMSGMDEDTLILSEPVRLEFPNLEDPRWKVLLYQIILHRNLTIKEFAQLFPDWTPDELKSLLNELVRSQLLQKIDKSIYTLDPGCRPYLEKWLQDTGILT
ncbi:MAG: amino acid permease [Lewinellaceae bacterium]|nr:amino acid permease [Lewinellaceae bacterium]